MKPIKFILLATAALASLAFALTIQQQDVAAFNDKNEFVSNGHSHQNCGDNGCEGNSAGTFNNKDVHNSFNCNSHRSGDECKTNSHDKGN